MGLQRVGHAWVTFTFPWSQTQHPVLLIRKLRTKLMNNLQKIQWWKMADLIFQAKPAWILSLCSVTYYLCRSEVTQLCPSLCNPLDCNLPGSSVHGVFQAGVQEWVAISFSRGSFQSRDWTWVSCIAGRLFTVWSSREAWNKAPNLSEPSFSHLWNIIACLSYFIHVQLYATLWTVVCQTPLSMGFSRQEYWSGLPCPSPGGLPNSCLKPMSLRSPAMEKYK